MPALSDDERLTVLLLGALVAVGSVLVGWPVDRSTVPWLAVGRLGAFPAVAGALLAALRRSVDVEPSEELAWLAVVGGLLGSSLLVGLLAFLTRSHRRRRRRCRPSSSSSSPSLALLSPLLRLGAVLLGASRSTAGSALLRRLAAPGSNALNGLVLGALVGAWLLTDDALRRSLAGSGRERDQEPAEDDAAALERVGEEEAEEAAARRGRWGDWTFTVEEGYFAHDNAPDGLVGAAVMPRLGLLDRSPSRWADLQAELAERNAAARPGERFKLLFVQRHGEGWHNVAETFYGHGSSRWCDEYAKLYFADGMVWGPDPELTPLGLAQAADVAAAWAAEIRDGGARAVLPRVLWTSPLKRAAMTLAISYGDVLLSGPGAPQPVIKENLRERLGVHTCDIRPPSYELETVYGRIRNARNPLDFVLEPGLTAADELWSPTERETDASMDRRARALLSELFADHDEPHVALAGHGGIMMALFRVTSHKACATPTGALIPMIVRGVRSQEG